MRRGSLTILAGLLIGCGLIAGCSSQKVEYVAPVPVANSRLLFDPAAGYPLAADLAYRSDWPSTQSVVQGPEWFAYRESIYDIQGLSGHHRDLTFRRFRAERIGTARR